MLNKIITFGLLILVAISLTMPLTAPLTFAEPAAAEKLTIPKPNTLPGLTSDKQKAENAGRDYVGEKVIPTFVNFLIGAAGIGCMVFLIIGGIQYLTAYGEEEALGTAKKTIIFSIVGLLVAMFSYAIVALISGLQLEDENPKSTFIPTAYGYNENSSIDVLDMIFKKKDGNAEFEKIEALPFADLKTSEGNQEEIISSQLYKNVINLALGIASILIIISFTVAGVMYITAQGDDEQMGKAKKIIIYTLIATAVIAASYAITLGITKLNGLFW